MEEGGRRSIRPISYLVPLELDCRRVQDDEMHNAQERETSGIESDVINEMGDPQYPRPSTPTHEMGDHLGSPTTHESSTSGSASAGPDYHTAERLPAAAADFTQPQSSSPTHTQLQASNSTESELDVRETSMSEDNASRPPRRAAQRQKQLLRRLIRDDVV